MSIITDKVAKLRRVKEQSFLFFSRREFVYYSNYPFRCPARALQVSVEGLLLWHCRGSYL